MKEGRYNMDNKLIGNENDIIFYTDEEGKLQIEVMVEEENVWLTQNSLSKLFETTRNNITMHIKNIYDDQELEENSTSKESLLVQKEDNAERNIPMYMKDWKKEVDTVLTIRHYDILEGKGKISKKEADEKAENEYEKYKIIQDKKFVSDFDMLLLEAENLNKIIKNT